MFSGSIFDAVMKTVLGGVVIIVIWYELRMRRAILREELELRKKQYEDEKSYQNQCNAWLTYEHYRITRLSDHLTDQIVANLKRDVTWASEALERAKIGPRSQTLFADRLGHFREEKEWLAEHFVPILLERCKRLVEEGRQVYLLIDSGTTLYPFFRCIGRQTVKCHENGDTWIDNLFVVTNNLPGVESLIENGRINPNNRYSDLAVKCRLLPGVPLPVYSAITGKETNEALQNLHATNKEATFIGLTTGNWIRLRRTLPRCPVPLARGEGHVPFKQTLIDNSDEMYVISPLGKVFANASNDDVNTALGYSSSRIAEDEQEYSEVFINDDDASRTRIVTTRREQGRLLHDLSQVIASELGVRSGLSHSQADVSQILPHMMFPFDRLPDNRVLELEAEFPHVHTRRHDFLELFLVHILT